MNLAKWEKNGLNRSTWMGATLAALALSTLAANAQVAAPPEPVHTVTVVAFSVSGNTLLPQATIDTALEPYKGQRTAAELKQAALVVQELYSSAGYGGVVAVLPEQSVASGVVEINVVEGRLAGITVTGNEQFTSENLLASVPALSKGSTPSLKRIDAQVQLANENPAKQLEILLQPGQRTGEIEASVAVQEEPMQRWTVALDNTGDSDTGEWRTSVGWQHANLWGRDHVLSLQYLTSPTKPSAVQVVSGGYRVPLYEWLTAIDAYAAYSNVDNDSASTLAGDLSFNGRGELGGIRVTRYLERVQEWDQRLSVGLDYRLYRNQCSIEGLPDESCGPAGESVAVQPISLEYSAYWISAHRLSLTAGVHHNLQWGGGRSDDDRFEAVRPDAKPRYTLWRLAIAGTTEVAEDWQLQATLNAQLTSDALVPGEQFGIGGISSVRGYEERELAGDQGVIGSVELAAPPVARLQSLSYAVVRPIAFIDGANVRNRTEAPCLGNSTSCTLTSVGGGVRLYGVNLNALLFVAVALKDAVHTDDNDVRAHFAVTFSF